MEEKDKEDKTSFGTKKVTLPSRIGNLVFAGIGGEPFTEVDKNIYAVNFRLKLHFCAVLQAVPVHIYLHKRLIMRVVTR